MVTNRDDQVVETVVERAPVETIEERVVELDGSVSRVVRTVGEPLPVAVVEQTVVARPAAVRRTVSRIWRRSSVPANSTTEYASVASYAGTPTLGQFLRITWFVVAVIEGFLALRFALAMLGANANNGFAALVYAITWPFVAPFRTLFGVPAAGGSVLETYTLIAMLVVFFGAWLAVRFVGVLMNRSVEG
jgi:uncharacterized protein YggT (Ycf19 family)